MNRISTLEDRNSGAHKSVTKSSTAGEVDMSTLWQAYEVSRDEGVRNQLLLHYLGIARMIARHLHGRMPATVELDDLMQAAALGLRSAIATFDHSRGIPFEHYCGPRVRGAILDHLRSLDWAPRMLRSRVQRVQEMARQIEMETGARATDEEVSRALDLPVDEVWSLQGKMAAPMRLRTTRNEHDQEHGINLDMMPDRGALDPLKEAQRADLREFMIMGLSSVERQVVILYYYENMSLREIGETLHLCESRVSQIHQAVIARLRERMHRFGGMSIED